MHTHSRLVIDNNTEEQTFIIHIFNNFICNIVKGISQCTITIVLFNVLLNVDTLFRRLNLHRYKSILELYFF